MKTKMIAGLSSLAVVSMAALIGGAALAQQATTASPTPRHARADTDGDGRVSQAEFVQGRIARLTALDANRDGTVTVEEMRAGRQARMAGRASARFDRLDADKNGEITRAEFDAPRAGRADRPAGEGRMGPGRRGGRMGVGHGMRGGMRGHGAGERMAMHGPVIIAEAQTKLTDAFTRLDTNHDGYVTGEERRAGMGAMREQRREHRAERRAQRAAPTQSSPSAPASE